MIPGDVYGDVCLLITHFWPQVLFLPLPQYQAQQNFHKPYGNATYRGPSY